MLRKSHLDYWESTKAVTGTGRPVDAIIAPAVAYTACPHGCNLYVPRCSRLKFVDLIVLQAVVPSTPQCAIHLT